MELLILGAVGAAIYYFWTQGQAGASVPQLPPAQAAQSNASAQLALQTQLAQQQVHQLQVQLAAQQAQQQQAQQQAQAAAAAAASKRGPVNLSSMNLTQLSPALLQAPVFGTYVPGGGMPPMPTGIMANGFLWTWSPLSAGKQVDDAATGTWIANASTGNLVVHGPKGPITVYPNWIVSLTTGEARP